MLAKMRVPAVEDEQCAILVAAVPRFMLDRVVERERLALAPFAGLAADPESAARRHDQRQMDDRAGVGDAGVRRDVLSCLEDRKENRRRAARNPGEREALDDL